MQAAFWGASHHRRSTRGANRGPHPLAVTKTQADVPATSLPGRLSLLNALAAN